MAEDSRRAPSGAALSKSDQTAPRPLDLRSWQGLTDVLSRARGAGLSDTAYAEFRDLVLQYAQGGGEPALLKEIETAVSLFSKPTTQPEAEKAPVDTSSSHPSSRGAPTPYARRPTPTFMPLHVEEYPDLPPPEAPPVSEASAANTTATKAPTDIHSASELTPPQTQPTEITGPTVTPPQAFAVPPQLQPSTPAPIPTELAAPTPGPDTAPAVGLKTLEQNKARIAEIKRLVNATVGNPATLMDPHNSLGREYMAALLSAMKASAAGGAALESALQALETTHRALLEHHANPVPPTLTQTTPNTDSEPLPAAAPVVTPPVVDSPTNETAAPPSTMAEPSEPESLKVTEMSEPEPVVTPRVPFLDLPNTIQSQPDISHETLVAEPKPTPIIEPELKELPNDPPVSAETQIGWTEPEPAITNPASLSTATSAVAPALSPQLSPPQADVPATADESNLRQADLTSPEVTTSLNQLLGEWNIFASSGLFGIGPGGAEHPLYRRLAALTMGEVMAGRWENATPEIRRTINDYVNAWRHEQAIAYNPTETFEHYLRRVVFRILKRQRG